MKKTSTCTNCSTQLQDRQIYCSVCGVLLQTSEGKALKIECETHPDQHAVGLCIVCGKPVCTDCEVRSAGNILCNDPEHKILLREWCVMHQPDSEFEAEAFVRNLADGGIEVKTFSLHDHVATHWLNESHVRLFVRKTENEKAKALMKELNLIDNYS